MGRLPLPKLDPPGFPHVYTCLGFYWQLTLEHRSICTWSVKANVSSRGGGVSRSGIPARFAPFQGSALVPSELVVVQPFLALDRISTATGITQEDLGISGIGPGRERADSTRCQDKRL